MPAIVDLSAVERAKIIKLLDNLNLGFVYSGFGKLFVDMLDGNSDHMEDDQKAELAHLINNLNLGFAHLNAGKLLVDLLDHGTQQAAAAAMTAEQAAKLKELLNNLNLGLDKADIGGLTAAAIASLAVNTTPVKPKITAKTAPAFAVGDTDKAWSEFFDIRPADAAVTIVSDKPAVAEVDLANKKIKAKTAGTAVLTATSDDDASVTDTVSVTIGPKP
ncbi:hypothetical protein ABNO07_003582 [Salmonella enterica subsp. enterica serovar Bareilly]